MSTDDKISMNLASVIFRNGKECAERNKKLQRITKYSPQGKPEGMIV